MQNVGRLTPCQNELIDSGLKKRAVVKANNGHGCLSGEVEQTAGIPKWSLDAGVLRRNLEVVRETTSFGNSVGRLNNTPKDP